MGRLVNSRVIWIYAVYIGVCFFMQSWKLLPLKCQENLHLKMSSVYVVCWIFFQKFQIIFAIRQTVWTLIRLHVEEQSDLGPHCLQNDKKMKKQTTVVVIGSLRVKLTCSFLHRCQFWYAGLKWLKLTRSFLFLANRTGNARRHFGSQTNI